MKAVKAVNAVYQNVDLSRLMDRVLALSRNNILGAFPGTNPFGFQARNPILSRGESVQAQPVVHAVVDA